MINLIKQIINRIHMKLLLVKPVVIPMLFYDIVVIHEGNGEWYHGGENPLQHIWYNDGNKATCLVCYKVVERRFINNTVPYSQKTTKGEWYGRSNVS